MIHRHNITRDVFSEFGLVQERFKKNQKKVIKRINQGLPVNFDGYKDTPSDLALFSLMTSETKIYTALELHLNLGVVHLQRAFGSEPTLKIKIEEEEFEVESIQTKIGTSIFDWWKLLNVSIILRHHEFQNELLTLLPHSFEQSKDPFWRKSMRLMLMCLGKQEFEPIILEHLRAIVDSGVVEYHGLQGGGLIKSPESRDLRKKLWLPVMELYYYALQGEEASFNDKLEEYILSKKAWIIENGEEDHSGYWIDFPLLACCSYAYDKNIMITVESEYIPAFVYQGKSKI